MHRKCLTQSGMTLIEITVAMAIFGVLMISAFRFMNSATSLQAHSMVKDGLRAQAENTLNWVMEQFQDVTEESIVRARDIAGTVKLDTLNFQNASFVRYKKVTSVTENGGTSGVYQRNYSTKEYSIGFRFVTGEINNGLDDNHNGLVDEGELIFKEYENGTIDDANGKIVKIVAFNVMKEYDRDPDTLLQDIVQGFSVSCEADDAASPTRWMIRVSVALEKIDPTGQFVQVGSTFRKSTKVYYKTTTLALYK